MLHHATTLSSLLGPSALPTDNRGGREPVVSKSLMHKTLALTLLVAIFIQPAPISAGFKVAIFFSFLFLVFGGILRVQECVGRYIARRSPVKDPGVEFPRRVAVLAERIAVSIAAEQGLKAISRENLACRLGAPSTMLHTPIRLHLSAKGKNTEIEVTPELRATLLSGLSRREIAYLSLLIGDRPTVVSLPTPSNHAILAEIARRRRGKCVRSPDI